MATAKKLPSGHYRVRVYDNDTKKYRSFTAPSKREAERMATEYLVTHEERQKPQDLTVEEAVSDYINSKANILSPASIRGYNIIKNNTIEAIKLMKISSITEKDLQKWVNTNSKKYAPKTIENQFGLVTAALRQCKVKLDFSDVLLPRIEYKEPVIPDEHQIATILHIVEGTNVELPVTMAVTLGLRQSEIAGLKWSDYDGERLHIHCAVVPNSDNKYQFKETTKSHASTRAIEVDPVLKERLDRAERKSEFISTMLPSSVLRKFQKLCIANGLPKFTMHTQRHGNASIMLKENVPDKYAMQRLGQSSPNMIKNVYQHLYGSKIKEVSDTVSTAFSNIYDTKYDTKK